ncbi:MAG TPA: nucleolar RNA-binding Nop10p family protein [Candidatus Nanoarchaeia archaeon]|nr:nucleolar RNA-binding Nop10p family protein [Candidatus Nanoarchaeia archaeon]
MAKQILKCILCGKYTLLKNCPECSKEVVPPKPPKFSLEDKYASYRRKIKRAELEKKGLI